MALLIRPPFTTLTREPGTCCARRPAPRGLLSTQYLVLSTVGARRLLPILLVVLALALLLLMAGSGSAERPAVPKRAIRWSGTAFEVTGLTAEERKAVAEAKLDQAGWAALFAVRVENKDGEAPAMLGSYRIEQGVLRFEPRFPPVPGVHYRATFDPSRLPGGKGDKLTAAFTLPRPTATPATVVQAVYPTRDQLPQNLLKFYLHFSAPMSRGEAYRHIRLLDQAGKPVERVFLELDEELWDPDGKRFTLYFHPGRIKKGLKPREELGPGLEEGKRYTLVIDASWPDDEGNPLKQTYRKTFRVRAPEEQPADPKTWALEPPAAATTAPLLLTFPRPMDHALLQRVLWITDAEGRKIPGTVSIASEEKQWQFRPAKRWSAGSYRLVVDTVLEDLAGNQVGRPFEVDVFAPIQREVKSETIALPFVVKE